MRQQLTCLVQNCINRCDSQQDRKLTVLQEYCTTSVNLALLEKWVTCSSQPGANPVHAGLKKLQTCHNLDEDVQPWTVASPMLTQVSLAEGRTMYPPGSVPLICVDLNYLEKQV